MALFNFFKKKSDKPSDILIPKTCPTEVRPEIAEKIDNINWSDFDTAYGNAEKTIPFYLKNLFCSDAKISMDATHQLWCSLCHQHAYISTASLPSYDILRIGLLELNDKLKIELLDIFQGFAECTSDKYFIAISQTPKPWEKELREKLINDTTIFKELITSTNEGVSDFACALFSSLTNREYNKP
jgi:hypothetical protein